MVFREQHEKTVFGQVGGIASAHGSVAMSDVAYQHPNDVRPPAAIAGRVGISLFIGELMMNPMGGHPEHRAAFQSHGAADREKIFNCFGYFVRPMGQQAVIAHPDSQTHGHPIQRYGCNEGGPTKKEKCRDCAEMKNCESDDSDPVDTISLD